MHSNFGLLFTLGSVASAAVHNVQVGSQGLDFSPSTVTAAAGDTVVFELFSPHDVVQGDFASPCTPSGSGFFSGPYSDTNSGSLRFVVNVTDTKPIYYYCSISRHCQNGMVGGINLPSSGNTLDAYNSAAQKVSGQSVTPTERRGGQLLSAAQISGSSSASSPASSSGPATAASSPLSTTRSAGASASAASASPSASPSRASAADVTPGQANGLVAMIVGIAAWVL